MNRAAAMHFAANVARFTGARLLIAIICLLPLLAGVSVMLCGEYERAQGTIVPRYLWDDDELLRKHLYTMIPSLHFLADRYGAPEYESFAELRRCPNVLGPMVAQVQKNALNLKGRMPAARDLNDYKNSLDPSTLFVPPTVVRDLFAVFLEKKYSILAGELLTDVNNARDVPQWLLDAFPDEGARMAVLDSLASLSIAMLNNDLGSSYTSYSEVPVPPQSVLREPRWVAPNTPEWSLWGDFVRSLPSQFKWMPTLNVYWRTFLRDRYRGDIQKLNTAWGTEYPVFSSVPVPGAGDSSIGEVDWNTFVLSTCPRGLLQLPAGCDAAWREYLATRFETQSGLLPDLLKDEQGGIKSALILPRERPDDPMMDVLWCDFIEAGSIPVDQIQVVRHEVQFGPFLRTIYLGGRIASLNEEWVTSFSEFTDIPLPLGLSDLSLFLEDAAVLRKRYAGYSWFAALRSVTYPAGVFRRTAVITGGMILISLLVSLVSGYLLARLAVRSSIGIAVLCATASLLPAGVYLSVYSLTLTEALGPFRWFVAGMFGVNMLTCIVFRQWFVDLFRKYREMACMDGVGELGFSIRFALRYSWQIILYMGVIHFLCAYCSIDWQLLTMARLWNWTAGVWGVDHSGDLPELRAASALLGMLPVFFVVAVCYPILSRYALVPSLRRRSIGKGE